MFAYSRNGLESFYRMTLSYKPNARYFSLIVVARRSKGLETEIAAVMP